MWSCGCGVDWNCGCSAKDPSPNKPLIVSNLPSGTLIRLETKHYNADSALARSIANGMVEYFNGEVA